MIEIYDIDDCKKVIKPWGHEIWMQPGSETYPFVLKQLTLLAGSKTSLQVHKEKSESIHIQTGTGQLLYWDQPFNCDAYLNGAYSADDLADIKANLKVKLLYPGLVFHTPPGTIHRMIAVSDLIYTEASTTELDDVIRLEDSQGRGHGRIDSEHV